MTERKKRRRDQRLTHPKGLALQRRDVEIIEAVYRFRVLKQSHIQALFFGSQAHAQYRLERLYDHKFLDRRFLPVKTGEGRSPTLYVIDRLGAELLRTEKGYDEISYDSSTGDYSDTFIYHTLAINDVMAAFAKACKQQGFVFDLHDWQTENEVKANYDRVSLLTSKGKNESVPILPDSVFTFIAQNRRFRCLLELDRGTMRVARFKDKIKAYLAYHESGKYFERYQSHTMRVLTVISTPFTGEKRLAELKKTTEDAGGKLRFWFTTLKEITPQTILFSPIWQLASSSEPKPLIDPSESA